MKNFFSKISGKIKVLVLIIIRVYQNTFSFDHGPMARIFPFLGCRFHPTCSEYTYQAVSKYGVIKGCYLGLKRLLRCNPLSKGGYDPVP